MPRQRQRLLSRRNWGFVVVVMAAALATQAALGAVRTNQSVSQRLRSEERSSAAGLVLGGGSQVALAASANVSWVTFSSSWAALEPQPGTYSWGELGTKLAAAKAQGLDVLLTLTGAPYWTSHSGNGVPDPDHFADYAAFAKVLGQQFGSLIDAYAFWNEPNHPNFWPSPDPVAYTHLQQAVYPAIKSVDPSAIVLAGPIAPTGPGLNGLSGSGSMQPYDFLEAAYRAGLRGSFDVLAWNMYPPGAPEDAFTGSDGRPYPGTLPGLLYVKKILDQYDPGRHIWVTELGWSTCAGCSENNINGVDEATQADYLSRAFIYRSRYLADFVDRLFWYDMQDGSNGSAYDDTLGLVRFDGSHKPAFDALANVDQTSSPGGGSSTTPTSTAPTSTAPTTTTPAGGSGSAPPAGSPGSPGAPSSPGTGGGSGSGPVGSGSGPRTPPKAAKVVSCAALKGRHVVKGKTVLALSVPHVTMRAGKLSLSVTASRVGVRTSLLLDGYRVTKWVRLAQRWLSRPSRLQVTIRDRGYLALRARVRAATSKSWQACSIAHVLTNG